MIEVKNNKLIIKKRGHIEIINLSNILFIERFDNKTIVQLVNSAPVTINSSLKELASVLPENFKKTHRSFIINVNFVRSLKTFNEKTYEAIFPDEKYALVLKEYVDILI